MWYILKFKDGVDEFELVKTASFNGYTVGDRFLEDCMFDINILDDGSFEVKANDLTKGYLESNYVSVSSWEKHIFDFLIKNDGYDCLDCEDGSEADLRNNLDSIFELGYKQVDKV